jgi:hypothetical protein
VKASSRREKAEKLPDGARTAPAREVPSRPCARATNDAEPSFVVQSSPAGVEPLLSLGTWSSISSDVRRSNAARSEPTSGTPRWPDAAEPVKIERRHARSLARRDPRRNGLKTAKKNARSAEPRRFMSRPTCHLFAALFASVGCSTDVMEPPAESTPGPRTPAPVRKSASTRVPIPGGSFSSGTEPGRFERRPELEPRTTRTALGPFEIDTEPYPGGPGGPLFGLGRDQAAERCAEREGRLCTELEWERACKGPSSHAFPSGVDLDPTCEKNPGCASGFGVWGMGSLREWTASELPGHAERAVIVRGAAAGEPVARRRCARRDAATTGPHEDVGFRCCYGAPNAAKVMLPRQGATFGRVELPLSELGRWLAADPATQAIASDLSYFDDAAATATVLGRGDGDRQGFLFTTTPLAWNPVAGVELLVVAARSGASTSFVVVFDALGDGSRQVASSFIMEGEAGPVLLAYKDYSRPRLHFSTCWGCPGETGKISYRDPDRASILQP